MIPVATFETAVAISSLLLRSLARGCSHGPLFAIINFVHFSFVTVERGGQPEEVGSVHSPH